MADKDVMVDKLIMLLSTDWFKPYWSSIGIEVDEATKTSIQQGCREIIKQILSGAKSYYHISFTEERKKNTRAMLESLAKKSEAEPVLRAIEEWAKMSDEEMKAAWIYTSFTDDLLSHNVRGGDPKLDPAIVAHMVKAQRKYDLASFEFLEKCESSETTWDQYTRELTPELPTALADTLAAVLTASRYETFWSTIRERLTTAQREELIAWYRDMAKARSRRTLFPHM
jgi:hypothetical protein